MKEEMKVLQDERKKMYHDVYNNIIPKRVPVGVSLSPHLVATWGGLDPIETSFDYSKLKPAAMALAKKFKVDKSPVTPVNLNLTRPPMIYQVLESQSFVMGKSGFVQHPEVTGMAVEDYDYLIEDPYACLLERVMPKQYKAIDPKDPWKMMNAMLRAKDVLSKDTLNSLPMYGSLVEENGYYPGAPSGSMGFAEAPYDFIGDQLRGFSGISMDIRRDKKRLKAACEAVLPLIFYWGLPKNPHAEGSTFTPLHMPTFMREKDFEDIWLPTYVKMTQQWAACGVRTKAFCEDNWMRYLDHLLELPGGTELWFEYGDPKIIKEKLGKKFILTGLYPMSLLKTGTKQEVIDKAKELLDIMMPGGGYVFGLDKNPLTLGDINIENYFALTEFLTDYGVYDKPGESYGTPLNSEGFKFSEEIIKPIESKYLFDWEGFKEKYPLTTDNAKSRTENLDHDLFSFYMDLLV